MINVIVPMLGESLYETLDSNIYPKILIDLDGESLIERTLSPLLSLKSLNQIYTIIPKEMDIKYSLSSMLKILGKGKIFPILCDSKTSGALSSCLIAIDHIDDNSELIIYSADNLINLDLNESIDSLRSNAPDCGVITFKSYHPKWSYVQLKENTIIESAEKKVISNTALTGFYYFKAASVFFNSAMNIILKNQAVNDLYYVSTIINELIIQNKKISHIEISKKDYFNFYDKQVLEEYRNRSSKNSLTNLTKKYIQFFNDLDKKGLNEIFHKDVALIEPNITIKGKKDVINFIEKLHQDKKISLTAKNIFNSEDSTIIEFKLQLQDQLIVGTDFIKWNEDFLISEIRAYFTEIKP